MPARDGDLQFKRLVRVTIATRVAEDFKSIVAEVVEIEKLRVAFKVTKTASKEPNTAEVTITNLSPTRRATLQQKGVKFILQAGYEGTGIGQLFTGDARTVDHKREAADWHTVIRSGDGERAFKFARVNEAFESGSPVSDVVNKIAGSLGLGLGNLKKQLPKITGQYVNGYAAHGPASRELDKVLSAAGYTWSIQDGELLIQKPDDPIGATIPELSAESGLIGSPEYGSSEEVKKQLKKNGKPLLKVRCLLNHALKIGSVVSIRSERHNGQLKIHKVEHSGDTHGGDWYTDFEGKPL